MRALFLVLLALIVPQTVSANNGQWQLRSPNGALTATIALGDSDDLRYKVTLRNRNVIEWSPLGLSLSWVDQGKPDSIQLADFSQSIIVGTAQSRTIEDRYEMTTGKRRKNSYDANELTLPITDKESGKNLDIIFQLADDGVAFRYALTDNSQLYHRIENEVTGFNLGLGGTHWGQVYDKASAWQPAYEAPYINGVPIGTPAPTAEGPGWGIPALFRDEAGVWVLVHEAGLTPEYHASHLKADAAGGSYTVAPPLAEDGLGTGSNRPMVTLPAATPWRFMVISTELADIFESNRVFDLASPARSSDTKWIKPGVSSWSWLTDHDSSRDLQKLKAHIDLAAAMGWPYSLVDANWNLIAPDAMEQLVAYADTKKVGLLFWYNSGGPHNSVTEEPRNIMHDRVRRRTEFGKLQNLGVKGVKIDFFHSDKQDRIRQYIEILEDAAEYRLLVNFHGSTIPRGWQRTYPHLMTMEAVRGGEHYSFDSLPDFAALSTYQNSVLPFTRNVIGSMDFTPVGFSKQFRPHLTTNAHEAALAVIFESGVQHMADSVDGYAAASADYKSYLRHVPTVWDESRLLSGYPGRDIVVARRSGGTWYIAGINSENQPKAIKLELGFIGKRRKATMLKDGRSKSDFASAVTRITTPTQYVELAPYGGFVLIVAEDYSASNP